MFKEAWHVCLMKWDGHDNGKRSAADIGNTRTAFIAVMDEKRDSIAWQLLSTLVSHYSHLKGHHQQARSN